MTWGAVVHGNCSPPGGQTGRTEVDRRRLVVAATVPESSWDSVEVSQNELNAVASVLVYILAWEYSCTHSRADRCKKSYLNNGVTKSFINPTVRTNAS